MISEQFALVEHNVIAEVVAARSAALAKMDQAIGLIQQGHADAHEAEDLAVRAHGGTGFYLNDRTKTDTYRRLFESFDAERSRAVYREHLDARIWMHLLNRAGMSDLHGQDGEGQDVRGPVPRWRAGGNRGEHSPRRAGTRWTLASNCRQRRPSRRKPDVEVIIDGVRYVPATDIPVIADADRLRAVKELVTALYLYSPRDRGTNGCIWDALRALAPDVAELAGNDPRAAYEAVKALEDRAREPQSDECPGAGQVVTRS